MTKLGEVRYQTETPKTPDQELGHIKVIEVIGLVQKHLVDRSPTMMGAYFEDPLDREIWTLDISDRDQEGKLQHLRFGSPVGSKHPEMFNLGSVKSKDNPTPTTEAIHWRLKNNTEKSEEETMLQIATDAEVALRRILRIPQEDIS